VLAWLFRTKSRGLEDGCVCVESWHKGSNAPSIRSLFVEEETMTPVNWLWSVLCVPFQCFVTAFGWQKGCLAGQNLCHLSTEVHFWNRWI